MTQHTTTAELELLKQHIRDVPDFPQTGVLFRDITPMLADPESFALAVETLTRPFAGVDKGVAVESRGFMAPVSRREMTRTAPRMLSTDSSAESMFSTRSLLADWPSRSTSDDE